MHNKCHEVGKHENAKRVEIEFIKGKHTHVDFNSHFLLYFWV